MTSGNKTAIADVRCLGQVSELLESNLLRKLRALEPPRAIKKLGTFSWKFDAASAVPKGRIVKMKWHGKNQRVFKCAGAACCKVWRVDKSDDKGDDKSDDKSDDDPVAHCELDDSCDTCGKTLFEETGGDMEAVCAVLDMKCRRDCSAGSLECVKDTLCSNTDDKMPSASSPSPSP